MCDPDADPNPNPFQDIKHDAKKEPEQFDPTQLLKDSVEKKYEPKEVIFQRSTGCRDIPRMMLLALYPPSGSVVSKEHDNKTSRAIYDFFA